MEVEEIESVLKEGKTNPRDIKMKLAHQIVAIYHGEKKQESGRSVRPHIPKKKFQPICRR